MKKVRMFPEIPYMENLIGLMIKYTQKIEKQKNKMRKRGLWYAPKYIRMIQQYNIARFQAIAHYQDICNEFYAQEKDFTYSLYQEQFDEDFLTATFIDEAYCLSIIENGKFNVYNTKPDSPNFDFNLNYYILESLQMGINVYYIRDLMNHFVPDNKTFDQYKRGVIGIFNEKRDTMHFSKNYDKQEYNELLSSINTLFQMKVNPNEFKPLFKVLTPAEIKKEQSQSQPKVLQVTEEDLKKFNAKLKLNNLNKER